MWLIKLNLIIGISFIANGLENGLARTPPMGWMHWERYRCQTNCDKYPDECIHENLFKKTADLLVKEGYAAVGYEYVIIDDCWLENERDVHTNKLVADHKRFPSGLKYLSDYIHKKGLKFGLYQNYGPRTCAGFPGITDHDMELDAQTFAQWGVDYVKLDGCFTKPEDMDRGYTEFGRFLNESGRPMVYSCSWPYYQESQGFEAKYAYIKRRCNLWRFYKDIMDSYENFSEIKNYIADEQNRLQMHAGPGHWNDPDMLILGNFGLSYEQSKAQMALWAILAAPLIMSNDLAKVPKEIKDILINKDIIAVNQDRLGIQGQQISKNNSIEIWIRPITPIIYYNMAKYHSYAVAFISTRTDGTPYEISTTLTKLGLKNEKYLVTDLFNKEFKPIELINCFGNGMETDLDIFETRVNPTGVQFYKFTSLLATSKWKKMTRKRKDKYKPEFPFNISSNYDYDSEEEWR